MKMLARQISSKCNVDTPLIVALDSRDLFSSLTTQPKSVAKGIGSDVNVTRYEFD